MDPALLERMMQVPTVSWIVSETWHTVSEITGWEIHSTVGMPLIASKGVEERN